MRAMIAAVVVLLGCGGDDRVCTPGYLEGGRCTSDSRRPGQLRCNLQGTALFCDDTVECRSDSECAAGLACVRFYTGTDDVALGLRTSCLTPCTTSASCAAPRSCCVAATSASGCAAPGEGRTCR